MDILVSLGVCIVTTLCFGNIDLIINIQRPTLNWTNPTAAVKNNLNIMISFLPRLVVGGLMFLMLKFIPGLSAYGVLGIFAGIMLVGYIVSRKLLYGYYGNKFANIEA